MLQPIKMMFDLLHKSNATDSFDIFETRIDGEFHGWSGNTLFSLANGQIWQQCANDLVRYYAHSPTVLLYRSGASIKMKVDGVDHSIFVKRIK